MSVWHDTDEALAVHERINLPTRRVEGVFTPDADETEYRSQRGRDYFDTPGFRKRADELVERLKAAGQVSIEEASRLIGKSRTSADRLLRFLLREKRVANNRGNGRKLKWWAR